MFDRCNSCTDYGLLVRWYVVLCGMLVRWYAVLCGTIWVLYGMEWWHVLAEQGVIHVSFGLAGHLYNSPVTPTPVRCELDFEFSLYCHQPNTML